MDDDTLRRLYQNCDPSEPLLPGDSRYVDLDDEGVRGERWVEGIRRRIQLSEGPTFTMLSGAPGVGISTELHRLAAMLYASKFLPVVMDAGQFIDLHAPIDVPNLLMALLSEAEHRVLLAEGRGIEARAGESPVLRLWKWLSASDSSLLGVEPDLWSGGTEARLSFTPDARATARQRLRGAAERRQEQFTSVVHSEFFALQRRARSVQSAGLVMILDSLERVQGTETNFSEVARSAEYVLEAQAHALRLPVHTISTVPPPMLHHVRHEHVVSMPQIRITDREGRFYGTGLRRLFPLSNGGCRNRGSSRSSGKGVSKSGFSGSFTFPRGILARLCICSVNCC